MKKYQKKMFELHMVLVFWLHYPSISIAESSVLSPEQSLQRSLQGRQESVSQSVQVPVQSPAQEPVQAPAQVPLKKTLPTQTFLHDYESVKKPEGCDILYEQMQYDAHDLNQINNIVKRRLPWMETLRLGVCDLSYWLVMGVDSWFGDKDFFTHGGKVNGRLKLNTLYREDLGLKPTMRYNLSVEMPNVSSKAFFFFGRENEEELVQDQPDTFRRSQQLLPEEQKEEDTLFAGIGYNYLDKISLRLAARKAYRVYAQLRFKDRWMFKERHEVQFVQSLYSGVGRGSGITTSLNYQYHMNPELRFQWRNSGNFGTNTQGTRWSTLYGFAYDLPYQRAISVALLANGETESSIDVYEYGVRMIYTRPVYADWAIGEVIVGHFWPRSDIHSRREEAWALGVGLQLNF